MDYILEFIRTDYFLIGISVLCIILFLLYLITLIKFCTIRKNYKKFMKNIGNGQDIQKTLEKYMEDSKVHELMDYKIFNFNGIPKYIQLDFNRFSGHQRQMYDVKWKKCNFEYVYKNVKNKNIDKPNKLNEMLKLARKISKDLSRKQQPGSI